VHFFWIYFFFLWFNLPSWLRVEERNRLKKEILIAYQKGDAEEVITRARIYQSISTIVEPDIRWMASQALLKLNQKELARNELNQLLARTDGRFLSDVYVSLARLTLQEKDTAQSILFLEKAILEDPEHTTAQFNYELLKKLYQPQGNPPPPKGANQIPQEGGDVVLSPEKDASLSNDPPTRIPRERALQMLDNLRANERSNGISKKNTTSPTNPKNDW